ncbi:hypothetical protein, partial [Salmonella sp. s54395]
VGALSCLRNGHGEVTFVDSKVVREFIDLVPGVFKLVCEDESLALTAWEQEKCHIGYTPKPVVFLNPERDTVYRTELKTILLANKPIKAKTSIV